MTETAVTREWEGQTAFLVGGGPSIWLYDLEKLHGKNVIVTNQAFRLLPNAPFLIYMDRQWFADNKSDILQTFRGRRVSVDHRDSTNADIWLRRGPNMGISTSSNTIRSGGNSGYCALNLAVLLGAKRIVLLGFDMRQVAGRNNYHNEHTRQISPTVYNDFIKAFQSAVEPLKKLGITTLNATPNSALQCFPFVSFEECLDM